MFCQPITHCYFVEEKNAADGAEVSICFFREFALQLTQYSIPIQKWRFFMYQVDFNHPIHVYFIGIGGISMSGLAEILLSEGFTVSGSDWNRSALTEHLEKAAHTSTMASPRKRKTSQTTSTSSYTPPQYMQTIRNFPVPKSCSFPCCPERNFSDS